MPGVESRQLDHLTAFTDHKKKVQERRRERAGQSHPEAHYDKNHREGEYSQNCVDEIMRANKRSSTDTERVEAAKCKIIHKKVVEGESELREEAEGGSRYAQKMFGSYLHSARNDTSTAVQYWKQCADSGDLECNVNVGMAYLMGHHNLEPDHHLAFKYISDAAKKGDAIAQYNLGMILLEGLPEAGIAVDRKGGLSGLLKAAQQKHTKAMIQLALQMLSHGLKGTKDQRRQQTKGALRWLNEADKLGSLEATTELGMCFKYGRGVRVNLEKSFAYFRKAADEGEMVAQYELALMYIYDDEGGSEQGFDDVLARKWMKAAAEQGHSNAMHNYANILLNHEDKRRKKEESSREKDIELALSMYAAAATQGVPDSLFNLGAFHSNGKFGLEKNDTIACQYFGAGARLGSKNCREAIVQYAEKKKLPEAVFQVGRMLEEGIFSCEEKTKTEMKLAK